MALTTETVSELDWTTVSILLVIENWEPFQRYEYYPANGYIVVVYLAGNPSTALLDALSTVAPERVIHSRDYDWTGLKIFGRVKASLPQALLYISANIETLFERFGRYDLIAAGGTPTLVDDQVARIVSLISLHNAGLEQEIVPLPSLARS